jgi:ribosomal protein S27E
MVRKVRCPVCRAHVIVLDRGPDEPQHCPYCQTSFVLPPGAREAGSGRDDDADT